MVHRRRTELNPRSLMGMSLMRCQRVIGFMKRSFEGFKIQLCLNFLRLNMSQRSIGNRFYMWTQPNFVSETDAQADDSEAPEQKVRFTKVSWHQSVVFLRRQKISSWENFVGYFLTDEFVTVVSFCGRRKFRRISCIN